MKLVRFVAPALAALAWGKTAWAQGDRDHRERLKKEIVKAVEEMLRAEEDRILNAIDAMLKEEFRKLQKAQPQPLPTRKARGYLGIRPVDLTDDEREELGLKDDEGGIRIVEILPDTPAAKAGLENDDVIVRVDGRSFEGVQGIVSLIGSKNAGQKVVLTIIRDGVRKDIDAILMRHPEDSEESRPQLPERQLEEKEKEKEEEKKKPSGPSSEGEDLKGFEGIFRRLRDGQGIDELVQLMRELIGKMGDQAPDAQQILERFQEQIRRIMERLGERSGEPAPPPSPEEDTRRPYLGVLVEPLAAEEARKAGLPEGEGLYVSEVREGSHAAAAGLRKGDILVRLRGKPIKGESSLQELMSSAKVGDKVEIQVLREGKELTLQATLGAR